MGYRTSWLSRRLSQSAAALLAVGIFAIGLPCASPVDARADDSVQALVEKNEPKTSQVLVAISVGGSYDDDAAAQIGNAINELRRAAGSNELAYSADLAGFARTRAAEQAFEPTSSHTRPDGSSALSFEANGAAVVAEYFAIETADPVSALQLFESRIASPDVPSDGTSNVTSDAPASVDDAFPSLATAQADSVGVAAFTTSGGTTVVAVVLGTASTAASDDAAERAAAELPADGTVLVPTSDLTLHFDAFGPLQIGASIPTPSCSILYRDAPVRLGGRVTWVSSDPSVVSVADDGNSLIATGCGDAVLTIACDDVPLGSVAVTVAADAADDAPFDEDAPSTLSVASFTNPPILYVASGSAWSPAVALDVTMPDGTPATVEPQWAYPETPEPDENGVMALTFDLDVNGTPGQAIQTVQFVDSWNADLGVLQRNVGDTPDLPQTVDLFYGSSALQVPITWSAVPEGYLDEAGALAVPGILTFVGTLPGTLGDFTVTLEIAQSQQAPVAVSASAATVYTRVGIEPLLPDTVEVTFSDGSIASVPVAWEQIDPALYEALGTFRVTGAIEGIEDVTATANVTVEQAVAVSIDSPTVETTAGETPALPQTVLVTWSDGTQTETSVHWEEPDPARYAQSGTFVLTGTIDGDETARATCTVVVNEAAVPMPVSAVQPHIVETSAGTAPVLPNHIDVVYSDQSVVQHAVTWDAVNPGSYHSGGTFTVAGHVDGTDLTVWATVNVAPAYVTSVQSNLAAQTAIGTMPKLPDTASVRWSNGDVTNEKVTWPAVNPSDYSHKGTFTVTGTVAGYSVPCQVTVVEQVVKTGDASTSSAAASLAAAALGAAALALSAFVASARLKMRG